MEENIFDRVAEFYDEIFPKHIYEYYISKRINFIRKICPDTNIKILDVGCGTGNLIYRLSKYGYNVLGIDISSKMVEIANQKLPGKVKIGNILSLDFQDNIFDLVIAIVMLHHLENYKNVKKAIKEMVRVTKKSGIILIWEHNPLNPYWYLLMKKVPQDTGKEKLIPVSFIIKSLKENGIVIEKIMKSGFAPEFVPQWCLNFIDFFEKGIQKIFPLNLFLAHNIIVGRKE
ncbi:MAG: methyltransferase domain-containing protein [Candidatus Omnitrophica bacterium]|nr:methyltransferase domain-containing protein [Candidatus Omnitrophota bacterium]